MLLDSTLYLAFNFVASVAVIFTNKLIFSSVKFKFTTILTVFHYAVNVAGLEVLAALQLFERRRSPLDKRLVLLCVVVGTAPALNNLSLKLNGLGFYQVVKLLVTPCIVAMEWSLYGARMSTSRALSLGLVCCGVCVACVNDLAVSPAGCVAAALWVPVAAVYKVLWSRVAKEGEWNTLSLMQRVLPGSTCVMLLLVNRTTSTRPTKPPAQVAACRRAFSRAGTAASRAAACRGL